MMKKKVLIIIAGLAISIIGIIITLNLSSKINHPLQTTGIIEAVEVDITPKISSIIVEMLYKEGDRVKSGDVVVKLDDAELVAQLKESEGNLQNAEASLLNARVSLEVKQADIKKTEAEVEKASAVAKEMRTNFERIEKLFKEGVVTKKEYDQALAQYQTSDAQLKIVNAQVELVKSQYNSALAQIESSKAMVKQAEANLEVFKVRHADSIINTPISGIIAKRYFELGERTRIGVPILTIIDDSNLWARVDIEERLINMINIGDNAVIKSIFAPKYIYEGRVIEIGEEGDFATQKDVKRGSHDIKTFRTKVEIIDNNNSKMLKPGMTVEVMFTKKG